MNALKKLLILLVVAVVVGSAGFFVAAQKFLDEPASSIHEEVIFEVAPGESFRTISHRLETRGLIKNGTMLRLYARVTGRGSKMRVGEYLMNKDITPRLVMDVITSGKSLEHEVTVAEGLNIFEIADIFAEEKLCTKEQALQIFRDKSLIHELLGEDHESLEGYLFPETYRVTKYTGARGLTKIMVERFKEVYAKLATLPDWNKLKLSRNELVTLASIIEKETGAPEERPVISSVFHNRLRIHMRLQTDPTVIYGIWEREGHWDGKIGRANLDVPTRYNTYAIDGLPFGPITNPGLMAIKAAGTPATSEYLFFVSHLDGTHVFSKSYAQHQGAVSQFLVDRKKSGARSWRDLKDRKDSPAQVREATGSNKIKTSPPPSAR